MENPETALPEDVGGNAPTPAGDLSSQPFLASALSVVVGPDALPGFLSELGQHIKREVERIEAALSPLWDEADRFENICRGEFGHRIKELSKEALPPNKPQLTIFRRSNKSLNLVRSMVRFLTAKASDEFFGTQPWSSFKPEQSVDASEAEAVGRWGRWKLEQEDAGFEVSSRQAIRSAFGNALTILKIQKVRLARRHAEFVQALVGADGVPVLVNGQPVNADDEQPLPSEDPMAPQLVGWPTAPDLGFMDPAQVNYVPHVVQKEVVTYDGPRMKLLFYKNFLCDPKIPNLDHQPFMGDTYEIRVGELRRLYADGLLTPEAFAGAVNAATDETQDKMADDRDGEFTSRVHWSTLPINRFVRVIECELDYEVPWADPAGGEANVQMGRLWAVVAIDTGVIIWADFLGNITPEGQTHYVVVTADSDETRLFGISLPQKYEDTSDFADATLNQVVYRNDFSANPPICYDPADFVQCKDGAPLEFKAGGSLAKTASSRDKKLEELIETVELPQMEEISQYLIDLQMKMMQTDSGVTGASQGDVGALPSQSTATGVRSVLGFGSVLHKLPLRELKMGLERAVKKFFDFALFRPAGDEFYNYYEGDVSRIATMTAAARRRLRLDVTLSLSRFADADRIDIQTKSLAMAKDYLAQLPEVQQALRSMYVRVLSDMGLPEAEQDLPPAGLVTSMPPEIPGEGMGAPAGGPAPIPMKKSEGAGGAEPGLAPANVGKKPPVPFGGEAAA